MQHRQPTIAVPRSAPCEHTLVVYRKHCLGQVTPHCKQVDVPLPESKVKKRIKQKHIMYSFTWGSAQHDERGSKDLKFGILADLIYQRPGPYLKNTLNFSISFRDSFKNSVSDIIKLVPRQHKMDNVWHTM